MDEFNEFDPILKTLCCGLIGTFILLPSCMLWIGSRSLYYTGLDPHNFMQLAVAVGFLYFFVSPDANNPRAEAAGILAINAVWAGVHNVGWYTQRRLRRAAPVLRWR